MFHSYHKIRGDPTILGNQDSWLSGPDSHRVWQWVSLVTHVTKILKLTINIMQGLCHF